MTLMGILCAVATAEPLAEAGAGLSYAQTRSEIPVVSDPPNWSGRQVIAGWSPLVHAGVGMGVTEDISVWGFGQLWWAPSPDERRDGALAPPANVRLAGLHAGMTMRYGFGPGLHAGAGLGLAGIRFRTSDSFVITRKPGLGISAELGWERELGSGLGLGASIVTTAHLVPEGGPLDTRWSGGEVGLRLRVATGRSRSRADRAG